MPTKKHTATATSLLMLALMAASLLSSCNLQRSSIIRTTASEAKTYPVDPVFREYYQDLGGESRLGAAITPLFQQDEKNCQFTIAALMCQDPLESGADRFSLAPLGLMLGLPADAEQTNGIEIPAAFARLQNEMNGLRTTGQPLTPALRNEQHQRIEQFFENVAFYQLFDQPDQAFLLPYGEKYHAGTQAGMSISGIDFDLPGGASSGGSLQNALQALGGEAVFGKPLGGEQRLSEGRIEQVFESVVVLAENEQASSITLRPIARELHMQSMTPAVQKYSEQENMVFYPVQDGLGFHVPVMFDQFLRQHGGVQLAGAPIAEPMLYERENVVRQCFENLCLDYLSSAAENEKVRLAPLGRKYFEQHNLAQAEQAASSDGGGPLCVRVGEEHVQVAPTQTQTIHLVAYHQDNQSPAANVEATITLQAPDGSQFTYYTPPTDQDGRTTMQLPPLGNLPEGSLVSYQACLDTGDDHPVCAYESYLIWGSQ